LDGDTPTLVQGIQTPIPVSDLAKFVQVHEDISAEIKFLDESSQQCDSLREILILLMQALSDCGVKQFSPAIGESYRTAFGVAPNPVFIKTEDSAVAWEIVEVTTPGFCMESPKICCIKEAVVVVYKYEGDA